MSKKWTFPNHCWWLRGYTPNGHRSQLGVTTPPLAKWSAASVMTRSTFSPRTKPEKPSAELRKSPQSHWKSKGLWKKTPEKSSKVEPNMFFFDSVDFLGPPSTTSMEIMVRHVQPVRHGFSMAPIEIDGKHHGLPFLAWWFSMCSMCVSSPDMEMNWGSSFQNRNRPFFHSKPPASTNHGSSANKITAMAGHHDWSTKLMWYIPW